MNDREVAIRVEHLGKRYRLGQVHHDLLAEKLVAGLGWTVKRLRGVLKPEADRAESGSHAGDRAAGRSQARPGEAGPLFDVDSQPGHIWALHEVSFEVRRGEVLGVIGHNGAGKSTLLKILTGVTEPSEGKAWLDGRVGSLLEVGTGFHPELTGRENIHLNGAILGMKRTEIDSKFEEIVDFSGVETFIDTPVKRYSSGMRVRLGFAVAAHLDPEILLVDEVLAVGDASFRKKCLGKIGSVAREGRTVMFVSHNMAAITRLCERVLWLQAGRLSMDGPSDDVVARYLTANAALDGQRVWADGIANSGVTELALRSVRTRNNRGEVTAALDVREPFWIEIEYDVCEPLPLCRVGVLITTADGTVLFETYDADREEFAGERQPGRFMSRCQVPANLFSPGRLVVSVNAGIPAVKNMAYLEGALTIDIENTGVVGSHLHHDRRGLICPILDWELLEI